MVSNPVHEKYLENIPSSIMQEYDKLSKKHKVINIVFDKTRNYYPDSLYRDSDHLNEMGAKRFSFELIQYIK
jgi:hypothetical protein